LVIAIQAMQSFLDIFIAKSSTIVAFPILVDDFDNFIHFSFFLSVKYYALKKEINFALAWRLVVNHSNWCGNGYFGLTKVAT